MSQPVTYTGVVAMGVRPRHRLPGRAALAFAGRPEDLQAHHHGHPVLMGRKTYESIGRPLPGRQNIVLTRDPSWTAEGVDVIHSVEELKRLPLMDPEVMVIGGAEIFSLMMPLMSRMWVSHISGEYPADTWLPPFEDRFRSANLHEQFEGFDLFLYE